MISYIIMDENKKCCRRTLNRVYHAHGAAIHGIFRAWSEKGRNLVGRNRWSDKEKEKCRDSGSGVESLSPILGSY